MKTSLAQPIAAALLFGASLCQSLQAASVDVPLTIDERHLQEQIGQSLGLNEQGVGQRVADECNHLDIRDLRVQPSGDVLNVSMAVTGNTGLSAFGRCRGPGPVSSQFYLELQPRLEPGGMAVLFRASSAELRASDGSSGMLTRPSRLLAENLILPLLESVRVDVGGPLAAIDQLIEEVIPATDNRPSPLAERGRLSSVSVVDDGLRAVLRFQLRPPPDQPPPEPVLDAAELAKWQRIEDELDGFLTVVIARIAAQVDERDQQLALLAVLLDTRQRIAEALASDEGQEDPVRALFLDAWASLRPVLASLDTSDIGDDVDLRLAGFLAAGDALEALDALGPEYGLAINRDGLRRLARLLLADDAPASFTPLPLQPDPQLQRLFGLAQGPVPPIAKAVSPSRSFWSWLIPSAHASTLPGIDGLPPAEALRDLVPRLAILDDYLNLVSRLLAGTIDHHLAEASRVPDEYRDLFDPLVKATAWKETCWRHYVGSTDEPQVIRSAVGAVGMMQIMGRVWRGVYDVERLESEVEYNVAAGTEILEHYLVDYAIRRGEHQQPGGRENLVRATYAAYNGGPSHLTRYRKEGTASRLRAIDNAFWRDYQQMKAEQWPNVAGCYSVGE